VLSRPRPGAGPAAAAGQASAARQPPVGAPAGSDGTSTVAIRHDTRQPPPRATTRLDSELARQLTAAGPRSGALVVDLSSGATLFALRAAVARAPASVEKLWTSVAALRLLGPGARLHTSLLGTGEQRGDVWVGNLYLRGGGDPTFSDTTFDRVWYGGAGPTSTELADMLAARGIRRVTGLLFADESLFDRRRGGLLTNQLPDLPDLGGQLSALVYDHGATARHYNPATFAAHELALTLRATGVRVTASDHDAVTPGGARPLASVSSPPLETILRLMNVPSDDLFAEMLAKLMGALFGRGGTIASGAQVISRTIAADYGLRPLILDGSGLSPSDRSSPRQVVSLLRDLWGTAVGRELRASLPVVGREGTVQGIALRTAAAGNCQAKTGTLNYVTNLAGYCAVPGHAPVAFAIFIDGPDNATAITIEGRMIAAIARG